MDDRPGEEALVIEARARASIDAVKRFFSTFQSDPPPIVSEDRGALLVELHPSAEPIRIEELEGEVHLVAPTHAVGPGYHRAVCEAIDALATETGARFEVSDAFFRDRDGARLEARFLDWLSLMARATLERAREGAKGFSWCTLDDHVFSHDGLIATQLGPRERAWVEAIERDPRHGIDFFPWWNRERDGAYFLALARVWMWSHVRWRAPLDEGERTLLDRVATSVERAHALDPALDVPWREQSEIFVYLGEESLRATRAHLAAESARSGAPIGYRRRRVVRKLQRGWSIAVPGELAERWDERATWVAWDSSRSIFFNSFTARSVHGAPIDTDRTLEGMPPLAGEPMELEDGDLKIRASFGESETGERRLEAIAARGAEAALVTIVFGDPNARKAMLEIVESLAQR
jgi:hypothetical protein